MKDSILKYFIYARKSSESEDRQVLSIESQKNELLELTKRLNLNIADTRDESHSAKAPGRPVFNQLLDDVEQGKAQGIIVWNPDRMSRNSVDTGRIIYLFDLGKLQELITPSQTFRNTPNDKFLLSMLCSSAKLDNDNKGVNVKRGLKAKAEMGIYPAPAPTGYLNNKYAERGNKTVEIDPERFDLVKKMFEMVLSQKYTPIQVLKIATNEWKLQTKKGKEIARSTWYRMLTNPVYAETFEYPLKSGNWHKAIHVPMITDQQFDFIQTILGAKGKQRPQAHIFAFTGLMRCGECGAMITCEEKVKRPKNGNVHRYIYYHCTKRINPNCTQISIEEKELSKQILEALEGIEIPPEFHDWGLKQVKRVNKKEAEFTDTILTSQQKAYKECLEEISELIDMRASKEITPEEFAEKKPKLETEKNRLKGMLDSIDDRATKWHKKADELFDFARDAVDKFNNGGIEDKRYVLSRLGSNLILKDKKLVIDLEETFIPMIEAAKEANKIQDTLEPVEEIDRTSQLEASYSQNPVMLRSLDSNQDNILQRDAYYHYTTPQSTNFTKET
jgi:site-specific DNA recombinase